MSNKNRESRRNFLKKGSLLSAGALLGQGMSSGLFAHNIHAKPSDDLAILGGNPVFGPLAKAPKWIKWPMWNQKTDEPGVVDVLRSGVWSRSKVVTQFEEQWAKLMGSKRCLTTVNGTNAMICALVNSDIGFGDEVIIPPYTFIATPQAVLQTGAIPVFVDTDRETFQMNPDKIEEKITSKTRAILPVHIAGIPSDMDKIMAIARKHNLVVIEDACQAWLSEIDHKKVGTFGHAGCFSFQNSKNIPIGEGGAIVSDDEEFIDRCYSYHNWGIAFGKMIDKYGSGRVMFGTKMRFTEYQAAIGLAQMKRFDEQTTYREENAMYLKSRFEEIPGIIPFKRNSNVTRISFHLFPFRYKKEAFKGLSRDKFLAALRAEGVPCSNGYRPLNTEPYLQNAFQTKNFRRMYSEKELDWDNYLNRNTCPENDILCNEEGAWFTQNILLGTRSDMDYIAMAIGKIQRNAEKLV